jgi:hypothetical protein
MFVGAVFDFGKIDALGHSPIIVVLMAILADDQVTVKKPSAILAPAYFCASLGLTFLAYYGVHAISYLTPNG